MEFLYALKLALGDLKRKEIQTLSLLNGIFWSVVWIFVGCFVWDVLKDITVKVINMLPFTFIQDAGTDFLLMVLWIQTVLVTLGILFSLFYKFISKKSVPYIISFAVSLFWLTVFFVYRDGIESYLKNLLRIFPFETVEDTIATVLALFMLYSFYTATLYLSFLAFSGDVLEKIKKEEYPYEDTEKKFSHVKLLFLMLRDLVLFIVLFAVVYPLFFVPVVNIVIIVFLWAFLIKASLSESVYMLFGKRIELPWYIFILSAVLNFIPLVNLYAPAFGELFVFRYVFEKQTSELT